VVGGGAVGKVADEVVPIEALDVAGAEGDFSDLSNLPRSQTRICKLVNRMER
jgi:hypothetical protein